MVTSPVMAADLNVLVSGIRSNRGSIAVAICDKANFPTGQCPYHGKAPAKVGRVTVHLTGLPAGTWAVAVYHDEAGIGRLQFSLLGNPKQGFGFSNDAKMHFGPPRFADAAFALGNAGGAISIPLHYPPK